MHGRETHDLLPSTMMFQLILLGLLFPDAVSSLALPRCLPQGWCNVRAFRGRERIDSTSQLHSLPSSSATLECGTKNDLYGVHVPSTMMPLSCHPLLLLQSSSPIMGKEACSLLSEYLDNVVDDGIDGTELDGNQVKIAEALLDGIHSVIDRVTNCNSHDGEIMKTGYSCRYVRYQSTSYDEGILSDPESFGDALLPDGLHVDTNNGHLFRHVTTILYLTDNQDDLSGGTLKLGGGTTFPLATPIDKERMYEHNNLQNVAQRLLNSGIDHTKRDAYENPYTDGRILEKAGIDVFQRDTMIDLASVGGNVSNQFNERHGGPGVRVMPEAGKLIYFHNQGSDGYADPISFHGGEELMTVPLNEHGGYRSYDGSPSADEAKTTKSILVFFKEIPVESFADRGRDGFAEKVEKARKWTSETYY